MAELLIEIGSEDLPAGAQQGMARHLADTLHAGLLNAGLVDHEPRWFATPRRIAALWPDARAEEASRTVERRGPSVKAAWNEGQPTRALQGFLDSAGATTDQLATLETPKGAWVVLRLSEPGKPLHEIVQAMLEEALRSMPMPRRMRWGSGTEEYLRPVEWLLALHGERVLPIRASGLRADRQTRGHRFHAPDPLSLTSAADYEARLHDAFVVADVQRRRAIILEQVEALSQTLDAQAVYDEALLDEVVGLVEWPVALAGRFDEHFLEIPDEALIQTMQENQRYFALTGPEGDLCPAFITIANIESSHPSTVIDGNERVIRPRFADTMFFWNQDKVRSLAEHRDELDRLLFQERLGSVGDKQRRLARLVAEIATPLAVDPDAACRAASLCKCDLVTELVKELPKMQGIAGHYYARRDGEDAAVAEAIEQHYYPLQSGAAIPSQPLGQVLAIADKLDTLVGIHGQGSVPTGAKDPFGLRRAALGLLRILVEGRHDLDLEDLVAWSSATHASHLEGIDQGAIVDYVLDRLVGYLADRGFPGDVVDAVLAKRPTRPLDIERRVQAIDRFRRTDAAVSLAAASKRIGNLLRKSAGDDTTAYALDRSHLVDDAEKHLAAELDRLRPSIDSAFSEGDYETAMTLTAQLREPVDAFFDDVLVMADDAVLRNNRLALLADLRTLCASTADLSRLDARSASPTSATHPAIKAVGSEA